MRFISNSPEETIVIGLKLARKLKKGDCVALIGDLGSGKTVLTKGIAEGLGVKNPRYVNSPTFVIIKEYKGKLPLYHFDLYRLNKSTVLDAESYEEYFYDDGVTVIEWADKIMGLLPKRLIEVRLKVAGESKRVINIKK
ncbi:MAG: tRNA (adenosine(37)-N6)-threonylcarbamoyltransferase complex ATPase subunit type 1 TsaE [Candidatus Omnitrophica bacterium]|nr:tRNA (adenosine(37)-N6)-threonylcarbamoyltransferase complex ATPase subunit type 1 TsaE [Candidatus Omnitrophota bacterium]MDD5436606.1 tRNA (adenosine(37)-N6)-threonylcarbamoyltransferase complex ATPase subunit type 1 TsaE [Candidatus Omnitrophota bacterium]